jgi:hypothetical protein
MRFFRTSVLFSFFLLCSTCLTYAETFPMYLFCYWYFLSLLFTCELLWHAKTWPNLCLTILCCHEQNYLLLRITNISHWYGNSNGTINTTYEKKIVRGSKHEPFWLGGTKIIIPCDQENHSQRSSAAEYPSQLFMSTNIITWRKAKLDLTGLLDHSPCYCTYR